MSSAVSSFVESSNPFVTIDPSGRVIVQDRIGIRKEAVDAWVRDATFGSQEVRDAARFLVWEVAHELGNVSSSMQDLYMARGRGECKGFTVPAMNIRGPTYDVARAAFRAAKEQDAAALIFELAKSEMEYTHQPPGEYATSILAAAIKEDWGQPVFVQGDHFQFNAKKYAADAAKETEGIRLLVRDAIAAGFHNIDIDASTLVDLSKPTVREQQFINSRLTADLTRLIRSLQPPGVVISIGGEIGEVGKKNSTPEELRAYVDQNRQILGKEAPGAPGVSKISVQTGTTHGGVVDKAGKVVSVNVDFGTLRTLSDVCVREYGLAGCVQHGASTLPDELFHKFPEANAAEIHLATGFQNTFFDHDAFPADLKRRIYGHLEEAHADERAPDQTLEQFHYKTRKKAFGPFKRELWDLPLKAKQKVMSTLEERFGFLYRELRISDTKDLVARHVRPQRVRRAPPNSLMKR